MSEEGASTSFAYDAWGRMTSKTRGNYSATYAWGEGDKLTGVASTSRAPLVLLPRNYPIAP